MKDPRLIGTYFLAAPVKYSIIETKIYLIRLLVYDA